jgi:hypothetical protein
VPHPLWLSFRYTPSSVGGAAGSESLSALSAGMRGLGSESPVHSAAAALGLASSSQTGEKPWSLGVNHRGGCGLFMGESSARPARWVPLIPGGNTHASASPRQRCRSSRFRALPAGNPLLGDGGCAAPCRRVAARASAKPLLRTVDVPDQTRGAGLQGRAPRASGGSSHLSTSAVATPSSGSRARRTATRRSTTPRTTSTPTASSAPTTSTTSTRRRADR